jgi:hypothetical protein
LQRGVEFIAHNTHIRDRHEQYLKILVIKEHQREHAAVLIQKRVIFKIYIYIILTKNFLVVQMRGVLARMAFVHVKRRGLISDKAVVVQTEYRRRLAQQRYCTENISTTENPVKITPMGYKVGGFKKRQQQLFSLPSGAKAKGISHAMLWS